MKRYSENTISWVFYLLALLIICVVAIIRPINKVTNTREIIATVTDKGIKNDSNKGKYLVYTKTIDGKVEVFEITDSLLAFRFDSSDVYAGIEVGKTYTFEIRGSRNRLFSWYPNIYDCKEVVDKQYKLN